VAGETIGPCPVCGREMIPGDSVDRHHWIPRTRGGRESEFLHVICHRMIHRVFSEKELEREFSDPATVQAHPAIADFVRWVRRKPADYVDWPRAPRARRRH
jgi:hypothetical protein